MQYMKKTAKLFVSVLCVIMMLVLITGCGGNSNEGGSSNSKSKSRGNYDVFETIKRIDVKGTIADINKLIGFEGTVKSQSDSNSIYKWTLYRWELTDDTAIEVKYYDSTSTMYVEAYYPNDMIKNKKVNLSDVKKQIKVGTTTYEEAVKALGGVEGTLDKKDNTELTYVWVNANGGSITIRFSATSGKCVSYNGVF